MSLTLKKWYLGGVTTWSSQRVNALLRYSNGSKYLEIGVQKGKTFREVNSKFKTAVDPKFQKEALDHKGDSDKFYEVTSDEFFSLDYTSRYDVVFLDGLHTCHQTYRDFCNSIMRLEDSGFILIDDVWPYHESGAKKERIYTPGDSRWWGDVFKIPFLLSAAHTNVGIAYLMDKHPQLLVWKLLQGGIKSRQEVKLDLDAAINLEFAEFTQLRELIPQFQDIEQFLHTFESKPTL